VDADKELHWLTKSDRGLKEYGMRIRVTKIDIGGQERQRGGLNGAKKT
jgi:hypothetical protein